MIVTMKIPEQRLLPAATRCMETCCDPSDKRVLTHDIALEGGHARFVSRWTPRGNLVVEFLDEREPQNAG